MSAPTDETLPSTRNSETQPRPGGEMLAAGSALGRYNILGKLGQGGMGVVYAAYDPKLDRKVAIKVIRGEAQPKALMRLQREAQAMARLAHPNVITVHDVGEFEGRLFVAMEFIDGKTLSDWCEETSPTLGELLEVFGAAARGLGAAHDNGLVHRDFKPDNVMVGRDGRVRVMDFGLARTDAEPDLKDLDDGDDTESAPSPMLAPLSLTKTGAVVGTPAYMAPEQHLGESVGARADQFSFCVALFEAIYGARPFNGDTRATLALAVVESDRRPTPRRVGVPRRVNAAIERGLSREPASRFANMAELVRALEGSRARWLGGGALLATAGVLFAFSRMDAPAPIDPCAGAPTRLAEVWDANRGQAIEQAFAATRLDYAGLLSSGARDELESYGQGWAATHTKVCRATQVSHERSAQALDASMACLDQNLASLAELVELFSAADADIVTRSADALGALPRNANCLDSARLLEGAPTAEVQAKVSEAEQLLKRLRTQASLARLDAADESLRRASELSAQAKHAPLEAKVKLSGAWLQARHGDVEAASQQLRDALYEATAANDDATVARAAAELVNFEGYKLAKYEAGERWVHLGEAARRALGEDAELESMMESYAGLMEFGRGNSELAVSRLTRAAELTAQLGGESSVDYALDLDHLALAKEQGGDLQAALKDFERAFEIRRARLGLEHPDIAISYSNLGSMYWTLGRLDEAKKLLAQGLAVDEKNLPKGHPDVAASRTNYGLVLQDMGDTQGARAQQLQALEIYEAAFGPEHPNVSMALGNLATATGLGGDWAAAEPLLRRALAIDEKVQGPESSDAAYTHHNLGQALLELGRVDAATQEFTRALQIREKLHGTQHPSLINTLHALSELATTRDEHSQARALLGRALEIAKSSHGAHSEEAKELALAFAALEANGLKTQKSSKP